MRRIAGEPQSVNSATNLFEGLSANDGSGREPDLRPYSEADRAVYGVEPLWCAPGIAQRVVCPGQAHQFWQMPDFLQYRRLAGLLPLPVGIGYSLNPLLAVCTCPHGRPTGSSA